MNRSMLFPAAMLLMASLGGCAVYPAYPPRPYAVAYAPPPPVYGPVVVGGWGWRHRYWR